MRPDAVGLQVDALQCGAIFENTVSEIGHVPGRFEVCQGGTVAECVVADYQASPVAFLYGDIFQTAAAVECVCADGVQAAR